MVYNTLTQRYTEEAVRHIRDSGGQPFFIELAHNMPHIPIGTSDRFKGQSRAGRYGDVIEEIDWGVGEVLRTLRETENDQNTLVVFLSDNGPWTATLLQTYDRQERGQKMPGDVGWSGLLRGSKATTYEGGMRVPAIFRWPGNIPAGTSSADLASILDLFPTFVRLAGGEAPADRPFDGVDILPLLKGGESPRNELFYFLAANLEAVRQGPWKLRIAPAAGAARGGEAAEPVIELFNLDVDPSERVNVAEGHPDLVERLRARMGAFSTELSASSRPPTTYVETVSAMD